MKITILVIEDNAEMSENICSILGLAHYNVLSASNGKAGIELAQLHHPDLILCDIMMPDLDGYGVLHILNSDPDMASIPFIFLTAKADKADMRTGMNLGADDYITKPFYGLDLLKVIEVRLRKSKYIKANYTNDMTSVTHLKDRANELRNHKLFEHQHTRLFRKKEFIFMEGQSASDLFYIVRGKVKTYKVNYEGKELITGFHKGGDYLGYVSLVEDLPHIESAEVREDSEIAIIPKQDFLNKIYSSRDIAKMFIKMLSFNLIEAESRLLDIAYQSVRQRVAGALLKIDELYILNKKSIITITRKDISSMIGTATESLNRTLADFKEEGLIDIQGEGIRILDKSRLERNNKRPSHAPLLRV